MSTPSFSRVTTQKGNRRSSREIWSSSRFV